MPPIGGNPIMNAVSLGAGLLAPTQYGPVAGPGFLDPWGAGYNAGLVPIPSPIQVVTGVGNSLGLPTLNPFAPGGFPTAPGLPFLGGGGGGGAGGALAAGAVAGFAGAGATAALLGPVAGIGVGALVLLLIVAAVVLYPLFKAIFVPGSTLLSTTGSNGALLLLLLLLVVGAFAFMGNGNSGAGGSDWTFAIVLLLLVFAAFGLTGTGLSGLFGG